MLIFRKNLYKMSGIGGEQNIPCGTFLESNLSNGIYKFKVDIGLLQGEVNSFFNAFGDPKRIIINYNEIVVADSLYIGDNLTGTPPDLAGGFVGNSYNLPEYIWNGSGFVQNGKEQLITITQDDVQTSGNTSGNINIEFSKSTSNPSYAEVTIISPTGNANFNVSVNCPTEVVVEMASVSLVNFQEDSTGCASCASIIVNVPQGTSKRVQFTKTGIGQYSSGLFLCSESFDEVGVDFTEVITSDKGYKFGIDAFKASTGNDLTTNINVKVFDDTTDVLEDVFTLTRTHTDSFC